MSSAALAGLLALAAAVLFGVGTALQSSAARAGYCGLGWSLVTRLVASPRWLAGTVVIMLGVVAHILALRFGPLVLVQPLALSGLAFALPIEAAMGTRRVAGRTVIASLEVVGGLGLLVIVAGAPSADHAVPFSVAVAVLSPILICCAMVGIWLRDGTTPDNRWRALCLGTAAGASLGVSSVLARQAALDLSTHGIAVLWTPATAGFVLFGLMGVVLSQTAIGSGQLSWSLPAQDVTALLTSIGMGAALLGEVPHLGPLAICVDALVLAGLTHGLSTLSRRSHQHTVTAADADAGSAAVDSQLPFR